MQSRKWFLAVAITLILVLAASLGACGPGEYPEKAVTLVVPFAAGGTADQTGRALAEAAKPHLSQPLVIVNRDGGAGTVGTAEVIGADPDGYTIGIVSHFGLTLVPHMVDVPWASPDDYTPIVLTDYSPMILFVKGDAPWQTLEEFLDDAKARPGEINVGSAGPGTPSHITLGLLAKQAQVDLNHVPMGGDAPGIQALLGGHIDAYTVGPGPVIGQVRAGELRPLATYESNRNALLPDTPTFQELGYDIALTSDFVIYGPKGMPDTAVQTLNDGLKKALESDSFKKFCEENNFVIDYKDPEELKQKLEADYVFFGGVVEDLDLKSE